MKKCFLLTLATDKYIDPTVQKLIKDITMLLYTACPLTLTPEAISVRSLLGFLSEFLATYVM